MRARPLPTVALLAALAACGGPILFAELTLPSVEVTLPQWTFPGALPPGTTLSTTLAFDVAGSVPALDQPGVDYDLRLTQMTLVLDTSGPLSNFDQVDRVTLTALHPAGSAVPDLVLVDYVNPHTTSNLTTITATSATNADLKPYVDAGTLRVEASYTGSGFPASSWTADVTADFHVKVKLDYGAYL